MPAKSGVSGAIIVVIPNVMGMMLYSPPLDKYGNSVRGMQFCKVSIIYSQLIFDQISQNRLNSL